MSDAQLTHHVRMVSPGETGYAKLALQGRNGRFTARPDVIYVPRTADEVAAAVLAARRDGRRIAVRSGGHCFENFVDGPQTRALIDLGALRDLTFDAGLGAFAVSPGARLGQVYRTLHERWGVTIPAGVCPDVGIGGHIAGGGYGALSRRHGLVVDHLHAVEVVTADGRRVVATRDPDDPHRDLWWAHTGGGGGTFGVVTRYWFRSPDADGTDPRAVLPRPPSTLLGASLVWQWTDLDEGSFGRLVGNYCRWHADNSGPDSAFLDLESGFTLGHRSAEEIRLDTQISGDGPDASRLMDEFTAAVTAGVRARPAVERGPDGWLASTLSHPVDVMRLRFKSKSAFLRRPFTEAQLAVLYRALSTGEYPGAGVYLDSFGGRINDAAPADTAMAHRDAVVMVYFNIDWFSPAEDAGSLQWIRELYRDVFAATGGVPVPDDDTAGVFVNYPDHDVTTGEWNGSGVPWHTLMFRGNYPELRRIKARWDPEDVFRHAMSVPPAS